MKNFIKIFLICLLQFPVALFSQMVSGSVYENVKNDPKSPLVGVNIYWNGTQKGSTTDHNGRFSLSMKGVNDKRLIISFVGYRSDTIEIKDQTSDLAIELHPADLQLEQVEIKDRNHSFFSKINTRQTQVITSGELKRAACCNLAESFETNASVDVSYSDAISGAKQIQLLGLSGIYSQVMTENVPLIRGLASIYGLNYIPGPWMESIQISKGTSSVANGPESVTGQINVEYKKPEKSDKFFFNLYSNSNLRLEANADGSVKINDKLSTLLAGHVDQFHNKFDRNDDGFMDLPMLETYNFFNRWNFEIPGKICSTLGVQYLDETRTGGQMAYDKNNYSFDTTGITAGTKPYGMRVTNKRLSGFLKNGIFLPDHPNASIAIILSGINQEQNGYYGINKYNCHERNFNATLLFTTSSRAEMHKISAGMSYMVDDYREDFLQTQLRYDFSSSNIFRLTGDTVVDFVMNRTEWVAGAFFEYTLNYKKFTLIAGLRGDYDNLWGFFVTPRMHLRYKPNETTIFRGSVGMGYRTANIFAENSPLFLSQRYIIFDEKLNQEKAINYGVNFSKEFHLFSREAMIDFDIYRTSFFNQVVVDEDKSPTEIHFYNLNGKSYANSVQVQFISEPVKRLNVTLAFRLNDVKQTVNGSLQSKQLTNQYKGLVTLAYSTKFQKWMFDLTGQLNGPARIPNAENMPPALSRPGYSPVYFQLLAQVTKRFKFIDIYIGGENLTNYRQKDPIIEYFRPYHSHFDASMVWGPVTGIVVYAGMRLSIKNE